MSVGCVCLCLQAVEKDELASRAKGDVVLNLIPLVDNFELARTQVKAETEAEQKINNSYQVGRQDSHERPPAGTQQLLGAFCLAGLSAVHIATLFVLLTASQPGITVLTAADCRAYLLCCGAAGPVQADGRHHEEPGC